MDAEATVRLLESEVSTSHAGAVTIARDRQLPIAPMGRDNRNGRVESVSTAPMYQLVRGASTRYVRVTFRTVSEVLGLAASFFGLDGVGLGMSDRTPHCAVFAGCGGYVCVSVLDEGGQRSVNVECKLWDVLADVFLRSF